MAQLTVVCFREAERWVAQCLEYDICATSESLAELPNAFNAVIEGHKLICKAEGLEPLESLSQVPARFRKMFHESGPVWRRTMHNGAEQLDFRLSLC